MRALLLLVATFLLLASPASAQTCQPEQKPAPAAPVHIRNIAFRNADVLSNEEQFGISKALRESATHPANINEELGRSDQSLAASGLADEAGMRVRVAYQNEGHFKVQVEDKAVLVDGTPVDEYDIVVRVVDSGLQYRLGDLGFAHATVVSDSQLRNVFRIQRGDIFRREEIAHGLEELRRLYGSQGYINYTGVPNTELDDDNAIVNLTVDVDEGRQFRLRSIKVLGLDAETKDRVLGDIELKPGDIFSSEVWERSFLKFRDLAQNPNPDAADKRLDERNGLVDVVLDFRKPPVCPAQTAATP